MRKQIAGWFSCCFGIGYLPFMPGTFCTIIGAALYFYLFRDTNPEIYAVFLLLLNAASLYCIYISAGDNALYDPSYIVLDELCGIFITLYGMSSLTEIIAGSILFRLFDIFKPFPVSYFDSKMKNAAGILMDDVAAGIMAAFTLRIFIFTGKHFLQ